MKAFVARFWRRIPWDFRDLPEIELQRMSEFAQRANEAAEEARRNAGMGAPTPGRDARRQSGKPGPDDEIVAPKKGKNQSRYSEFDGF